VLNLKMMKKTRIFRSPQPVGSIWPRDTSSMREGLVWRMAAAVDSIAGKEESLLQAYTVAEEAHSEYLMAAYGADSANVSDSDLIRVGELYSLQ
jgi:hypothetical protein